MMTRKLNCVIEANAILGFQSIVSSTNWIFEFDDDPFVSFPIEYFFFQYGFFLLKLMHRTTCWNREFELLYTTKREIEFQEIQKYQWNAQKIPDIMVKCFSSGGHFAASEAVK